MTKEKTFEELMESLNNAAQDLQREDITLAEAMEAFESGLATHKECKKILESAKQKIETYGKETFDE